ncbi:MAG: T9SS type A sorting domain-containing protein [bacterium]|nr:T9SS type A sorting domain-containing protein [bacterium]
MVKKILVGMIGFVLLSSFAFAGFNKSLIPKVEPTSNREAVISGSLRSGVRQVGDSIATVDNIRTIAGMSCKSIIYDPSTNYLQVVYLAPPASNYALHWATSTNGGTSWTSMGPLGLGYRARYPGLAVDPGFIPYIGYYEQNLGGGAGFFTRDDDYAAGSWWAPFLLDDTTTTHCFFHSVDIDENGYLYIVGWDLNTGHDWLSKSTDGGVSFAPPARVVDGALFHNATDAMDVACGSGGYLFGLINGVEDTLTGYLIPYYLSSTDGGATWTTPARLMATDPSGYDQGCWWYRYDCIVHNNKPYTVVCLAGIYVTGAGDTIPQSATFFSCMKNGNWVHTQVTPDLDTTGATFLGNADCPSIGVDGNGYFYITYIDYPDTATGFADIYLVGIRNDSVFYPVRITNTPDVDEWGVEIAEAVGSRVHMLYVDYTALNAGPDPLWHYSVSSDTAWVNGFWKVIGVEESSPNVPTTFILNQNKPNPVSNVTTISYALPLAGTVSLNVYDIAGRLVRVLVNGKVNAGVHTVSWNREDDSGSVVADGVYFCRLQAGTTSSIRKLVVLK